MKHIGVTVAFQVTGRVGGKDTPLVALPALRVASLQPAYPSVLFMKTIHKYIHFSFFSLERRATWLRSHGVALLMGTASVRWLYMVTFGIFIAFSPGKKVDHRGNVNLHPLQP